MNSGDHLLARLARDVYMPPFAEQIPLDFDALRRKSTFSILWRKLRPDLSLRWHRQTGLQRNAIEPAHRRVLWIYKGSPQVGDSLMDLSSRVLLKDRGLRLDLYTDRHLHQLFHADDIFTRVFSEPGQIDAGAYDLVILDSFKWRCLEAKFAYLPRVPFVTMRGYFAGPEFNRTLFSLFRMKQLLRIDVPERDMQAMAAPHLAGSDADRQTAANIAIPEGALAFAVGGASPGRTYPHWDQVMAALCKQALCKQAQHGYGAFVLLGSANGVSMRDRMVAAMRGHRVPVIDCVDKYTLTQTFEILKKCRLAACADGGLLHVAHAAHIPTVALFDRQVSPDMRLTAANRSIALQSPGAIGDLPAATVADAVARALAMYR